MSSSHQFSVMHFSLSFFDSIAQWIRHWSALPKICRSWNLQGATIPIGTNVSVGIFIPPSVIKILLLHFILGVSLGQLHSIRSMDHLMVVAFSKIFPSCPLPAGPFPFIKIICSHKESFLVRKESCLGF